MQGVRFEIGGAVVGHCMSPAGWLCATVAASGSAGQGRAGERWRCGRSIAACPLAPPRLAARRALARQVGVRAGDCAAGSAATGCAAAGSGAGACDAVSCWVKTCGAPGRPAPFSGSRRKASHCSLVPKKALRSTFAPMPSTCASDWYCQNAQGRAPYFTDGWYFVERTQIG